MDLNLLAIVVASAMVLGSLWLGLQMRLRQLKAQLETTTALPKPELIPQCRTCKHWNHEEGQAAMRANPAFFAAIQTVTPQRMTRTITNDRKEPCPHCFGAWLDRETPSVLPGFPHYDDHMRVRLAAYKASRAEPHCSECNDECYIRIYELTKPTVPARTNWNDFGGCMNPKNADKDGNGSATWAEDSCDNWEAA